MRYTLGEVLRQKETNANYYRRTATVILTVSTNVLRFIYEAATAITITTVTVITTTSTSSVNINVE